MSRRLPPITGISGGVRGMAAAYDAMRALATTYAAAGDRLRDHAADDARVLSDGDLLESAPLSPMTFAEAEARVIEAGAGVHGALEVAVAYRADALLVRALVAAYQECDRLVAASFHVLDYAVGRAAGEAVVALTPELLVAGLVAVPTWQHLPAETRRRLDGEVEDWVDEHPEVVQHGVDGSGGLLDGLLTGMPMAAGVLGLAAFHPTLGDAAADLAGLYPTEGLAHVRRRADLHVAPGRTPPHDLSGLMRHLDATNDLSTPDHPDAQGTIEVQTLRAPDGTVRHVVYLPGTDSFDTVPWRPDADVRDLPADLHVIAGDHATYAAGIERAMREAGIGPHDPVLLVGHSLGGMEAASLLAHGSGFDITHVVTAGSPVGGESGYPPGTHVLSLENRGDVVPLLDGRDNADSVQQVTVRFDDHETSVVANHDLRHYVRGARAAEASTDPSVREQLASLRATGFLTRHGTATSQVFQISR
jgi:hypothetical protein